MMITAGLIAAALALTPIDLAAQSGSGGDIGHRPGRERGSLARGDGGSRQRRHWRPDGDGHVTKRACTGSPDWRVRGARRGVWRLRSPSSRRFTLRAVHGHFRRQHHERVPCGASETRSHRRSGTARRRTTCRPVVRHDGVCARGPVHLWQLAAIRAAGSGAELDGRDARETDRPHGSLPPRPARRSLQCAEPHEFQPARRDSRRRRVRGHFECTARPHDAAQRPSGILKSPAAFAWPVWDRPYGSPTARRAKAREPRQRLSVDQRAVLDDRRHLAQVLDVLQRVGIQDEHVRALAGLERPELGQAPRRDRAVFRSGHNRLGRRHAQFDEPLDGHDRADAVILVARLRRARELRRRGPVAVGADGDDGASPDQRLRVLPSRLELQSFLGLPLPHLCCGLRP